jgi:cysteinyl-tRNA synthetase
MTNQAGDALIRVYNTLTRQKEPFRTVQPGQVGIYLCGPTVYKEAHIGHMVGPVIFDTIKRYLVYNGYQVTWVVNITDIDDKIIAESERRQIPIEIVRFIEQLIERDFAYASAGDVYFAVDKDPDYGKLSNRTAASLQGVGGEAVDRKRAPGDFALWKRAKPGEPSWPSPWGPGRPGWHIECSAMSRQLLGETFDIHGGGLDLIFPHHENEIAQSECCHGKPMVRYWMHNGLMKAAVDAGKVGGRSERERDTDVESKISRSKGAGGLADLIRRHTGERLRFFLLRTHYRSTIVFGEETLAEAGSGLEAFYRFFDRFQRVTGQRFYDLDVARSRQAGEFDPGQDSLLKQTAAVRAAFLEKMDDDFNTGGAVSELFELVRVLNRFVDEHSLENPGADPDLKSVFLRATRTLKELSNILGLFHAPPMKEQAADNQLVDNLMRLLIQVRAEARKNKDFGTADRIRNGLADIGVTLEDRKEGTTWSVH